MVFNFGVNTEVKHSKKLKKKQEKVIRIISFNDKTETTNPLFKKLNIMKTKDILTYSNCFFVHNQINKKLPNTFTKYLIIASNQRRYNTRGSKYKTIIKTIIKFTTYGLNSIKHRLASDWNEVTKQINRLDNISFVSRTKFAKSYNYIYF